MLQARNVVNAIWQVGNKSEVVCLLDPARRANICLTRRACQTQKYAVIPLAVGLADPNLLGGNLMHMLGMWLAQVICLNTPDDFCICFSALPRSPPPLPESRGSV